MIEDAKAHAQQSYPHESCGVVVVVKGKERYIPCRNIASGSNFAIHPEDYADAEDKGVVTKIVHSHPNASPKPSQADVRSCEETGLPWLIVSVPSMETYEFEPTGYKTPLLGREFSHGVLDCYSFIRDYYAQVLNIKIPDFDRTDNWWQAGDNLYLDGYQKAGFERVDDLQKHDVILMKVASPVPNHGAIYVSNNIIEHHQVNRLSSRDVYGGWYQKISVMNLRHKDLM